MLRYNRIHAVCTYKHTGLQFINFDIDNYYFCGEGCEHIAEDVSNLDVDNPIVLVYLMLHIIIIQCYQMF